MRSLCMKLTEHKKINIIGSIIIIFTSNSATIKAVTTVTDGK